MASEGDFTKVATLAKDATYLQRIRAALIFKCLAVLNQGKANVPEFEWIYALGVVRDVDGFVERIGWVVAAQSEIVAEANNVQDLTIEAVIERIWRHMAGLDL